MNPFFHDQEGDHRADMSPQQVWEDFRLSATPALAAMAVVRERAGRARQLREVNGCDGSRYSERFLICHAAMDGRLCDP